ncbi:MAG: AAA family ATPase, partial [Gemmataceae bacterium]|nr:AAA family ATPase [Gemmataceae bacterium]
TQAIYTFRERSSGLKYFLSYYIQARALEMTNRNRNSIILMDEPDAALSIVGQRNLLSVFESLVSPESSGQTCQLIYTTHSPYLINRNFPRRIRVVKKEDAEEGTQYIEQARSRRYEPVRTALGIDNAPSLFLNSDNVLVEGATEQYLIAELVRIYSKPTSVGDFIDLNSAVIVSADGVGNVENVLEQSRWADEPIPPTVIVVDSDKAAQETVRKITGKEQGKAVLIDEPFVRHIGDIVKPYGSNKVIITIEDIIPVALYAQAVLGYFKKWLPETWGKFASEITTSVEQSWDISAGLVEATKNLFRKYQPQLDGDYDKMGVFQLIVNELSSTHASEVPNEDAVQVRKNLIAICDFIRAGLDKSRAATLKSSTSQRVKRIIRDFSRLNKQNVAITSLQKLFNRLEAEVAPIGPDGEDCLRSIRNNLTELDVLRTKGQERVVGDAWESWSNRIDRMRKNPLSPVQKGS